VAIDLEVMADEKAAARRAAELIAAAGSAAVTERNMFSLAMSGGRSPWIASPGSEDRNLTHMVLGLSMDHQATLRPMPVTQRDLEAAAADYENTLPDPLDCVHLGLGPDGHTASLVPGDPVLDVTDRRVALTETAYQGHRRMTLTYPALASTRQVVWLITGPDKVDALAKLLAGDRSIPAGRVENAAMTVVADEAAAGTRQA
jgi:6-phosphogluconolactonase/glucosamine-6-phosphate isomerase/deaminase